MKPRILIDVDGVLADFVGGVRGKLATRGYPQDVPVSLAWPACLSGAEQQIVQEECQVAGFCYGLRWYPGARRFLKLLQLLGDTRIVTTPWVNETWEEERRSWLHPHIHHERVHFAHDKSMHDGEIMVEDNPVHLAKWWKPGRTPLLIDRPWNQEDRFSVRVYSYTEALEWVRAH